MSLPGILSDFFASEGMEGLVGQFDALHQMLTSSTHPPTNEMIDLFYYMTRLIRNMIHVQSNPTKQVPAIQLTLVNQFHWKGLRKRLMGFSEERITPTVMQELAFTIAELNVFLIRFTKEQDLHSFVL